MPEFERIFAPVGQGAFYFERHYSQMQEECNMVYDCGAFYLGDSKKRLVRSFFNGKDIDILFISHFDYDHVSLIPDLIRAACTVKLVFIPFLYDEEKKILVGFYRILGKELGAGYSFVADLIEDPENIFGDDSIIIEIMPWEKESERREEGKGEEIDLDTIPMSGQGKLRKQKRSGSKFLKILVKKYWLYIPYNFRHSEKAEKLKQMLKEAGIDVNRFANDISYLNNLVENENYRREIRKIYNKLEGNVNSNSLIVYSGPFGKGEIYWGAKIKGSRKFFLSVEDRFSRENAACLYTGDMDLTVSDFDLRQIFNEYWKKIGTIQVPHHGSKWSFSHKNFRKYVCAPISTGKNPFGHPSPYTLQKLISLNTYPILVTETVGFKQFGYAW